MVGSSFAILKGEREGGRGGGRGGEREGKGQKEMKEQPHTPLAHMLTNTYSHAHTYTHTHIGRMSLSDHPQLVINTLVTLNNLTYYTTTSDTRDSSITSRQEEIAQCKHVPYIL